MAWNILTRILLLLFSGYFSWGQERTPIAKPNILILFADDLGYGDLGCYGHPLIKTPHLDRLAADGLRLTSFYVAASVCSPSRAGLLTGRYPVRSGITGALNPKSETGLLPQEVTLAELLREQGYRTYCIGKWHLGHRPEYLPTQQGFDEYYGVPYSNDTDRPKGTPNTYFEGPPLPLMHNEAIVEQPVDQALLTRKYTEKVQEIIKDLGSQPFFLYLAYTMPHVPIAASAQFNGTSEAGLYGDVVEELDWSVGQLVAALRESDQEHNTLVIFTSDNGPFLNVGEPRFRYPDSIRQWHHGSEGLLRDGKFSVYEGGFRMPGIIRYPARVAPGRVSSEMLTTLDLFVTLAGLAGAAVPSDRAIDGRDARGFLSGKGASPREVYFYYQNQRLGAVRWRDWKLHFSSDTTVGHQLYHLSTDVMERYDRASRQPEIVRKLKKLANDHRNSLSK